ncbi:MAG TPA: M14 family metallopeptidase [Candidatus Hydrogenedentes bacterium]|nr:M14 family metallopeptidase [Candidatus Hydrogenedentota bacterium]HQH53526.1 M14 family metallopeptidase [Candidatus Hydrogenedentota bacterium]
MSAHVGLHGRMSPECRPLDERRTLVIAGQDIPLGETRELQLPFDETYLGESITLPIYVMRAPQPGPRLFLTGTLHGDELNGMGIIRELLYGDPLELLRGSLILIPVINIHGLERHSRYMPDRRDPNRCFPGSSRGSQTSRMAHAIFTEIVRQCDYGIDFHSAAIQRVNYPNVRAYTRNAKTRMLAEAFGCELIVNNQGPQGSLRRSAVQAGVPSIILEAGEVWKIEPAVVEIGVRGVLNVLRTVGMLGGEPSTPPFQLIVTKTTWVRAPMGGILDFHARPGDVVRQGDCLATMSSIFGQAQSSLAAPVNGIVLGMTTMPVVKPGGPVYHIAALSKRKFHQAQHHIKNGERRGLLGRVRRELVSAMPFREHGPHFPNEM